MSKFKFSIYLGTICSYIVCAILCTPESYAYEANDREIRATKSVQQPYKGRVVGEDGSPLQGASVRNITNNTIAVTDPNGLFTITGKIGDVLEITYAGYERYSATLQTSDQLDVRMVSAVLDVEEVVVMGYNSLRESNISGAVGRVDMSVADKRRVQDVGQLLQGQTAGVNVTQSTGQPGDAIDIRIRGVGTIGNNSPLFIVDGVPTTNFSFINPADIESMSVLKDASAASIYGSRAAAGVILVTTKKGKSGEAKFDVNAFTGIQQTTNLPTMMNTSQYLNTLETAWNNTNSSGTNPYTAQKMRTDLSDTDWLGELFENGKTNSFQLSASGGSEKVTYMLSTGYYDQDGIVVYNNDRYRRLELRSNINAKLTDRIEVKSNILLNHQDKMVVSSRGDSPGIVRHALLRPPVLGLYKDPSDPTYAAENPFTDLPFYVSPTNFQSSLYEWSQNPVALAHFSNNNQKQFKLFGNVEAGVDILKDKSLRFRSTVGLELNFNHNKAFMANFGDDERVDPTIDVGLGRINRPNGLNEDRGEDYTLTWNNVLNYDKTLGDHQINALAGTEFINNQSSSINASRRRFEYTLDRFQYMDLGGTAQDLWNGGYAQEWALFSLFSSATYSYKSRYSVTGNIRADASTRFGSDNKWGYFPSLAVGWTLSNEDFFPENDLLNYVKFRGSSGKLGNQNITNYAYLTLFSREGNITRYGNPNLKWETTLQNNFGVDMRLFSNKLELNVDIFHKKTNDILLAVSLPTFVGNVDATYVNAGQVENKGFELNLRYRNTFGNGGSYSFGGNLTGIKNEVASLHENVPRIIGEVSRAEIGQPLDVYYGYEMEGIYQNAGEVLAHQHGVATPNSKPGDLRFKDLNNDGIINDADRGFIGNPIPRWSYGLFGSIDYKGFDLNIFFQGVDDVDRYNDGMRIINFDTRPFNYTTRMLDAWNGEGSSNTLPRVAFEDTGVSKFSTLYIEDASYLRLKNVELGYSFGKYLNRYGLNNARIYLSAQNLYTWTSYTGLDPETTDLIDRGTYPQSKSILLGLNFNF
ncbi:TonB-dependent receptor [Sphingobacterium alkalisoli]|uniref:TonB-dependent receptor n=1 Tax=Sphingobacterium alkalisoli TaxID=1874115 RepID=A0A4U0H334_9SPHI|nr:TonB-dependent receptor [Sphingobacterium alkalisoli]TJY65504.1 TonB-dependent receptor [Sphingobacterium alkalisoli]GGH20062.1 SusC/RagA family TonB-linked outer membrane protein [Sphingobacterium alkalisoli]